jgi:UDP-N-acetylmuramoyl-L-alanyl-D-glutamate--2,6-diaminopimelate ligase
MTQTRARQLSALLKKLPLVPLTPVPAVRITGVASDSRQVLPGYAFVVIKGESSDGMDYLAQAAANGAVLAISDRPGPQSTPLPFLQVEGDPRRTLAYLAAGLNNHPARKLRMIGVTGTDGKTTTTSMIHHILSQAGIPTGMISTVSAVIGAQALDTGFHVTTPDAPAIQGYLAEMVAAGMTHCVLESTSHGLAQGRVIACDFDVAVVTNVTHEHLDYHGSYEKYLEAKGLLFESLAQTPRKRGGNPRLAVLNKDDRSYPFLKRVSPPSQVSYSTVNQADLWADGIENTPAELRFRLHIKGRTLSVRTGMVGVYNVSNCLAAIGATVFGARVTPEQAVAALGTLPPVPGRMERIDLGQNFITIVDFAHTPNALTRALETARGLTTGRVIAVYGSAGLRDREKRRMMPKASIAGADLTILTAEDPRTESLDGILMEMAASAVEAGGVEGQNFWRVPDRGDAIRKALRLAQTGDLVIVCGKGHEQSMCFETQEYHWDDREAAKAALAEFLQVPGPQMPWLPTSNTKV